MLTVYYSAETSASISAIFSKIPMLSQFQLKLHIKIKSHAIEYLKSKTYCLKYSIL